MRIRLVAGHDQKVAIGVAGAGIEIAVLVRELHLLGCYRCATSRHMMRRARFDGFLPHQVDAAINGEAPLPGEDPEAVTRNFGTSSRPSKTPARLCKPIDHTWWLRRAEAKTKRGVTVAWRSTASLHSELLKQIPLRPLRELFH